MSLNLCEWGNQCVFRSSADVQLILISGDAQKLLIFKKVYDGDENKKNKLSPQISIVASILLMIMPVPVSAA